MKHLVPPFYIGRILTAEDMRKPARRPLSRSTIASKGGIGRISSGGLPDRRRSVGRDASFGRKEARIPMKMFVNLYSPDNRSFEVAPHNRHKLSRCPSCDEEDLAAESAALGSINPWQFLLACPRRSLSTLYG